MADSPIQPSPEQVTDAGSAYTNQERFQYRNTMEKLIIETHYGAGYRDGYAAGLVVGSITVPDEDTIPPIQLEYGTAVDGVDGIWDEAPIESRTQAMAFDGTVGEDGAKIVAVWRTKQSGWTRIRPVYPVETE